MDCNSMLYIDNWIILIMFILIIWLHREDFIGTLSEGHSAVNGTYDPLQPQIDKRRPLERDELGYTDEICSILNFFIHLFFLPSCSFLPG